MSSIILTENGRYHNGFNGKTHVLTMICLAKTPCSDKTIQFPREQPCCSNLEDKCAWTSLRGARKPSCLKPFLSIAYTLFLGDFFPKILLKSRFSVRSTLKFLLFFTNLPVVFNEIHHIYPYLLSLFDLQTWRPTGFCPVALVTLPPLPAAMPALVTLAEVAASKVSTWAWYRQLGVRWDFMGVRRDLIGFTWNIIGESNMVQWFRSHRIHVWYIYHYLPTKLRVILFGQM